LKKEDKLKYIEAVRFPSGPYGVNRLPILDTKETASNSTDVAAAVEFALKEVSTKPTGDKGSSAVPADGKRPEQPGEKSSKVDYGKPAGAGAKLPGAGVAGSSGITPSTMGNNISAFDIVRFKTYGLKELDANKVISLTMLEIQMAKKVTFQGTKAVFEGNPNELLEKVTTYFGIPDLFGTQAAQWNRWFIDRFLPVYLNYATLHMIATNKAPKADGMTILTPNQQYDTAVALSSTSKVWQVSKGPWGDYELNTNPETIKGNLDYLKGLVRDEKLPDKESKPAENAKTKEMIDAYKTKEPENGSGLSAPQPGSKTFSPPRTIMPAAAPSVPMATPDQLSGGMGGNSTGSGSSQGAKGGSAETNKLLDFIGAKESNGNYNILVGGKTEPNLTNMSISEVINYQDSMIRRGHESTAVGKYQIIKPTLKVLLNKKYASPSDKFSPEVQDKLAVGLLKGRGLDKYLSGKITKEEFADNLSKEWASLPYKTGASYYAGVGSNKSSGTRNAFVNVVAGVSSAGNTAGAPTGGNATTTTTGNTTGGIQTAVYDTTPPAKSPYNPVARPAIKQKEAVDASRQASAPPMGDVNGFNPATLNTQTQTGNATKNTLTGNVMVNTENLLGQSLDVQKQTLDVMKMIYDKINAKANTEEPGNGTVKNNMVKQANGYSYEPPKAPVPMRKT
jgi:muramidase (phage lysozyme)